MAKDKTKKKNKTLKKIILAVVITLLGTLLIVAGVFLGKILKLRSDAKKIMSNVSLDSFRQTETSIIYDINGKEISALSGIKELYYSGRFKEDVCPDRGQGFLQSFGNRYVRNYQGGSCQCNTRFNQTGRKYNYTTACEKYVP